MGGLQGWMFLLLLGALAVRGMDRLRLLPSDLAYAAVALGVAVVQKLMIGQITLDDPWFSPMLMALPVVAGMRGGVRGGLAAGAGVWLGLTAVAGAVPVAAASDLSQETFVLATMFGVGLGAAAGALSNRRPVQIAMLPIAWLAFFGLRDIHLMFVASVVAVPAMACGYTLLATALLPTPVTEPA